MQLEVRRIDVSAFDGTQLAVFEAGGGPGIPIVIVNGPGADVHAWHGLIDEFGTHHRVVTWDYRGFYGSGQPADLSTLSPEGHANDLTAVLMHLGIEKAVFVSWSLGTQVLLEFYRRNSARFAGMVSVNGTFGHPFRPSRTSGALSPLGLLRAVLPGRDEILRNAVTLIEKRPQLLDYAKRLHLVSPSLPESTFLELASSFAGLNTRNYTELLRRFAAHDGEDVLRRIRCPALFFAGRRDPFVPSIFSFYMAAQVRDSELCVIPIASHYIPIEFAEYLNLRIEAFLAERLGENEAILARPAVATAGWEMP